MLWWSRSAAARQGRVRRQAGWALPKASTQPRITPRPRLLPGFHRRSQHDTASQESHLPLQSKPLGTKEKSHCWGEIQRPQPEVFSNSWIVLKLVDGVVWTHALYNHLWAEIIFFERPLHVHIHCLEVIVVVVVSVVIVVVVVIVVDVVVYVHDGVDGNEDKGKEGKGIEAGLRRTTGGRSRLWGPATCPCCWQTLGGGDRQGGGGEQRFQIMEVGQVWREVHDGHREICAGGRWHNTQVKARITVFRRYQSQAGENCFWRLHRYISKLFCLLVSLKAIKMLYMSLWNISILSVKSWSPVVSRMSLSRWKCSHLVFPPPKTTVNVTKIIL